MATYFEAVNRENKISLDDTTPRMGGLARNTVAELSTKSPSWVDWGTTYYYTQPSDNIRARHVVCSFITAPSDSPFIAIRPKIKSPDIAYVVQFTSQPNVYRVWSLFGLSWSAPLSNIEDNIDVFYPTRSVARDRYGLEVFDANGSLVFSSAHKYLNITGAFTKAVPSLYQASKNGVRIDTLEEVIATGAPPTVATVCNSLAGGIPMGTTNGSRRLAIWPCTYGVTYTEGGGVLLHLYTPRYLYMVDLIFTPAFYDESYSFPSTYCLSNQLTFIDVSAFD